MFDALRTKIDSTNLMRNSLFNASTKYSHRIVQFRYSNLIWKEFLYFSMINAAHWNKRMQQIQTLKECGYQTSNQHVCFNANLLRRSSKLGFKINQYHQTIEYLARISIAILSDIKYRLCTAACQPRIGYSASTSSAGFFANSTPKPRSTFATHTHFRE